MNLHIVSGFLGSGKTTAIIGAAKHLMAQGKRVGVVTNDQGKYLVDTAFFTLSDVPTVEVTGGCFCCNYDDLDARLDQLKATTQPDTIFAESVGSCADIVATVVKPLLTLRSDLPPTSFSVFSDARLLRRRLLGQPMPFSEDVVYIFDQQILEAGLLVINKLDLLEENDTQHTYTLAQQHFPNLPMRLQNSLEPESIAGWVDLIESGDVPLPQAPLDIDYARYGAGEARLAWLDETLIFHVLQDQGREALVYFLEEILTLLQQQNMAVGHLKCLVRTPSAEVKLSFPSMAQIGWQQEIPKLVGPEVTLLMNVRVEAEAQSLRALVQNAITRTTMHTGATAVESDVAFFHPHIPNPTHRMK